LQAPSAKQFPGKLDFHNAPFLDSKSRTWNSSRTTNQATPSIDSRKLDVYLNSHLIEPSLLRSDKFEDFMEDRQKKLLPLIEQATGKAAYLGTVPEEAWTLRPTRIRLKLS
jgi:hypothetical protein